MKAKFLPLLLLAILLQVSMFSFANEMTSARRIRLKNKTEVQHRSIPVTPDACIENSLLSIDLLSTVPTVTVIIKNAETDEVVYTSTDLNVDKVYIDLTGEENGVQLDRNTRYHVCLNTDKTNFTKLVRSAI